MFTAKSELLVDSFSVEHKVGLLEERRNELLTRGFLSSSTGRRSHKGRFFIMER
jgi:hypothetical protein